MLDRADFAQGRPQHTQGGIGGQPADLVKANIRRVIAAYKADFAQADVNERYKWEAIGWYQKHWDIKADDFASMLKEAFGKAKNLLASGMYYPYKMLLEYAEEQPEEVRALFRMLHDETLPLEQRYVAFRDSFKNRMEELKQRGPARGKALQHYQDLRAVMVYLTFEYPEKYFLFKSTMYTAFRDRVGFAEEKPVRKSAVWKVESYIRLCEQVLEEVQKDRELTAMSRERLDGACYQDGAFHLLTMDIIYYGGVYMAEEDFRRLPAGNGGGDVYWPSLREYDPGITREKWTAILNDASVTTPENLDMLKKMLDLGGESTCAHLAEVYGNVHNYYNKLGSSFGEKVKRKLGCPDCMDGGAVRYFPIPFVGRYVTEAGSRRYSWKLRSELMEALEKAVLPEIKSDEPGMTDVGLNTILYGPPGTGKTYHTVIYAVAVIENRELAAVEAEDYDDVLARYHTFGEQGRIAFTTFHQSYGYEEFIEGIRPTVATEDEADGESGEIRYSVQPGIFKRFCERAEHSAVFSPGTADYGMNESPNIWKVSLEGTGDNPTRTECMKNGHIRIGWDQYGRDITDETDFSIAGGKKPLNAFMNRMRVGDIVLSCYSASAIDAVGVVTGEYEWHDEYARYKRLRRVNWIVKGIQENILPFNGGTSMTLSSVYRMANMAMADIYQIIEKYRPAQTAPNSGKRENYVFIIDEINRGSISRIFGELITLIESSKRTGRPEGMTAVLPYSQKPFGVPENVYIIGTMNTADRSIAAIDTALRRRFSFREMLPNAGVLADVSVEDLSISELLTRMNQRITVLYDREHTIGHACFMPLIGSPTVETLAEIFENHIIPLLQEYFYEDYEKIRLILGDNRKSDESEQFIVAKPVDCAELFGDGDIDLDVGSRYEINRSAFGRIESYRSI